MRVHEYQAKQILDDFDVPVPPGKVATDPAEAADVFRSLPDGPALVKAQSYELPAGGGRGVIRVRSAGAAAAAARELIGRRFGHEPFASRPVTRVLVESMVDAQRSLYLAVAMDPHLAKPVMLAAPGAPAEGGVSRDVIDPRFGTLAFQWRKVTVALGLEPTLLDAVTEVASGLYRAFIECECIEAEIGSLGLTSRGGLVVLQARVRFDDSALSRHEEIAALIDPAEFSDTENALRSTWIRYVPLAGRIGCVALDTGSALATLDRFADAGLPLGGLLYLSGDEPAEKIAYGITTLLRHEALKAVVVRVPRHRTCAGRVVEGIRTAAAVPSDKPILAVAASPAAREAADALAETAGVTVAGSDAEAIGAAGGL
jgi:succinyl-CoA synthetase beta subunit